jgi:predicted phosphatase
MRSHSPIVNELRSFSKLRSAGAVLASFAWAALQRRAPVLRLVGYTVLFERKVVDEHSLLRCEYYVTIWCANFQVPSRAIHFY